jgi:hypothetical protein
LVKTEVRVLTTEAQGRKAVRDQLVKTVVRDQIIEAQDQKVVQDQ